jgi:large subunit ribosomal protein L23
MNLYEVLRQPVVTEKSNYQNASLSQYVFEVASGATKTEIKDAIEKLFEVEVVAVNTLRMPAKRGRRLRKITVRQSEYKKAVVWLKAGNTIEFFEGVK